MSRAIIHRSGGLLFAALLMSATTASAQLEQQKLIRLEQDVRKLERIVQDQAQQIEELKRRRVTLPNARSKSIEPEPSADESATWLSVASWGRLHEGMSELEVIDVLGPPTSMRSREDGARILLYALEIGSSGFLGGNVTFKDHKVVGIEKPVLR